MKTVNEFPPQFEIMSINRPINNIVYNLLNIIKIEYTNNTEMYDMLFYNICRLHYKKISNICKYPHHIKEKKKKQIIRLLFLFLVLERILANVLVESCIAIGFHLRQLREAFLVNKAYFMAIGIGQNEYSNRCLAGRI